MDYIKLRNNIVIPQIGLGTWQITDRDLMQSIIKKAYDVGYRLIDTAAAYSNEIAIAKAISGAGIGRTDIMLSDKVWNTNRGYEAVQEACRRSLKKLKTDYLDLYLIHWPASPKLYSDWENINAETWRGMERLMKDGLVRAIGVCNFKSNHLEKLKKTAEVMPLINQIEFHPGMPQKDLVEYCMAEGIHIEASSPLGNGQVLKNETLEKIANKYGKNTAQICLRWEIQKKLTAIPKTANVDRLASNLDIFDFALSSEDMETIDRIPFCGGLAIDSDEVVEFG